MVNDAAPATSDKSAHGSHQPDSAGVAPAGATASKAVPEGVAQAALSLGVSLGVSLLGVSECIDQQADRDMTPFGKDGAILRLGFVLDNTSPVLRLVLLGADALRGAA